MRKIKKDFDNIPLKLADCNEKHKENVFFSERQGRFNKLCYKQSREKLRKIYHKKCAYCESKLLLSDYDTIEHYRPKSKYFWLAYEWSNLFIACNICNNAKSNKFALSSQELDIEGYAIENLPYKITNKELVKEKPLLINPEIDDPNVFLTYDSNGKLKAKRTSYNVLKRGEYTINICRLNRDELRKARKEIIDEIFKLLKKQLNVLIENHKKNNTPIINLLFVSFNSIFEILREESEDNKKNYTLIRKTIYIDFESYFIDKLKVNSNKRILRKAFMMFKNGTL